MSKLQRLVLNHKNGTSEFIIKDENAPAFDEVQNKTEEEKAQARQNSGALAIDSVSQTTGDNETKVMSQKAVTEEFDKVFEEREIASINLFDKNSAENKNGYMIQSTKPYYIAIDGYTVTHPIRAEAGMYTFYTKPNMLGANALIVAPCNSDGQLSPTGYLATDNGNSTATITIGENWENTHFAVNIYSPEIDSFMVVKGSTMPSEYHPHEPRVCVRLVEDIDIKTNLLRSHPLYGKKVSLNGDSICYGAGSTGGYGKIIADTYNMTLQNLGVSGGTITAETYYSDEMIPRHWVCRTIKNMDVDADYAIVEGGVNDASLTVTVPLGAITNTYNAQLDDTTFYGAFESMCKQLITRFAGKKVGYIAVHKMTDGFNSDNEEATSYYWAAKKCCEKWGIPFLDLNVSVPAFAYFKTDDSVLYPLREAYTQNADGWHPNEEGYKRYYVPKIVKWLEML